MTKNKIRTITDQRPFSMIYHDCLESKLFDNHYQIIVYIALKKFADNKNKCFPSLSKLADITRLSKRKVQYTLQELEQKHIISIENRVNANGGKSSNLYTLYDFKELWDANNSEEAAAVIEEYEENKLISILEARGYKITKENRETMPEKEKLVVTKNIEIKEKELVSESNQTTDTSNNKQITENNNTTPATKSQPLERYTLNKIKQLFDYNIMLHDYPDYQENIDSVMSILHVSLNTTKDTIKINGEDKPAMMVIAKLMKLDKDSIIYAINKFSEQTNRIKNPVSYMLTILYNAPEQYHLDIQNQLQHDMVYLD